VGWFRTWYEKRVLRQHPIDESIWSRVISDCLQKHHLTPAELVSLRIKTTLFLHEKTVNGAGELIVNDYMRTVIASSACLLILNLDLEYYSGWREIIVYPSSFIVQRDFVDAVGVVHHERKLLGGESWSRGPVIISWQDAEPGSRPHGLGSNVILHEFAHKLDMKNGAADGLPPLHRNMNVAAWARVFQHDYDALHEDLQRQHRTRIDPYAATNPAEFFAVATEEFFEEPARFKDYHLDVYDQLVLFYRQDPLGRRMQV